MERGNHHEKNKLAFLETKAVVVGGRNKCKHTLLYGETSVDLKLPKISDLDNRINKKVLMVR